MNYSLSVFIVQNLQETEAILRLFESLNKANLRRSSKSVGVLEHLATKVGQPLGGQTLEEWMSTSVGQDRGPQSWHWQWEAEAWTWSFN